MQNKEPTEASSIGSCHQLGQKPFALGNLGFHKHDSGELLHESGVLDAQRCDRCFLVSLLVARFVNDLVLLGRPKDDFVLELDFVLISVLSQTETVVVNVVANDGSSVVSSDESCAVGFTAITLLRFRTSNVEVLRSRYECELICVHVSMR